MQAYLNIYDNRTKLHFDLLFLIYFNHHEIYQPGFVRVWGPGGGEALIQWLDCM